MNIVKLRVPLSIKIAAVLLLLTSSFLPSLTFAQQDSVVVTSVDKQTPSSWYFKVTNHNNQSLPINHVYLWITATDGSLVQEADGPAGSGWLGSSPDDQDTLEYDAGGESISPGTTLSGFDFIISFQVPDQGYQIGWATYSNSTLLSTGSFNLLYTVFQSDSILDTATAITSMNGGDPVFRFKAEARNYSLATGSHTINGLQFQLLTQSEGQIRPSYVKAPFGWHMDSVQTSSSQISGAFFSAEGGFQLDPTNADVEDSFIVSLRANPLITSYGWVLWCYSDGAVIDRDTIRGITARATGSASSNDSVTAAKTFGCLYTLNLENFHASNQYPPSRLTQFSLTSTTSGVTFAATPETPPGWNATVSGGGSTVTFKTNTDADGIPSGIVASNFEVEMNNSSGGAFALTWNTQYKGNTISTGALALSCAAGAAAVDSVAIEPSTSACQYGLKLSNLHNNPPSNLYGVSLAITDGSGTFDFANYSNEFYTSNGWSFSSSNATAIRYSITNTGTSFMTSGDTQNVFFVVNPTKSGAPVNITWTTYDQNGNTVTGPSNFAVTCSPIVTLFDSVWYSTSVDSSCIQDFGIYNKHTNPITIIKIVPHNGWFVDSASAPVPWTASVVQKDTAIFTSSQGLSEFVPQTGFKVGFVGKSTDTAFGVEVLTVTSASSDTALLGLVCPLIAGSVRALSPQSGVTLSAHPNPFQTSTDLMLHLPIGMRTKIELVDVLGQTQQIVQQGFLSEGDHSYTIQRSGLPTGTYYLRLETAIGVTTKKIVLTR